MRGSAFLLEPLSFDCQKARKIPFFFLSLSSSLSLYPFFHSLLPCLFFFSSPCFPSFPFLSHRIPTFFMFVPLLFFHLIFLSSYLLFFSSLSFSLLFLISPLFLFDPHPSTEFVKKWGKLPPTFLYATCHHHVFLPYFFNFFSHLLHHITHGSM